MGFSADTLHDRIAIVPGASQGIGRAIVLELAAVGAHVGVCSRRLLELETVADTIRSRGRRALALACDVGEANQVEQLVKETLQTFGRIAILVNNAGYRIRAPLDQLPLADWQAMVQSNLMGVFLCCQAVGRVMLQQRAGKIVNITSVGGAMAREG
jgi:3-oxoacyl-[acyl-carrier protein] reductase